MALYNIDGGGEKGMILQATLSSCIAGELVTEVEGNGNNYNNRYVSFFNFEKGEKVDN